jgi:hypothetical protein
MGQDERNSNGHLVKALMKVVRPVTNIPAVIAELRRGSGS